MIERCPKCNANLAMVGRSHRCVPMPEWAGGVPKSSDGGVEGHDESRKGARKGSTVNPFDSGMLKNKAGIKPGPSDASFENDADNRSAARKADKSPRRTASPEDARLSGHAVANPTATVQEAVIPKRAPAGTFDRKAYQREYMRKRRQKEKAK